MASTCRSKARRIAGYVILILIAHMGNGCGRSDAPGSTSPSAKVAAHTYRLRGVVVATPEVHSLRIRHEPIDGFIDRFGEVVGMDSMTMPFDVAAEIQLGDLKVGDKIACEWSVDPGNNIERITTLTKLSPDTELHFGKAHPPGATTAPVVK